VSTKEPVTTKEPVVEKTRASQGPGRPRDAGHDRAILGATLRLLQEHGYAGLTIEGVAAAAGVSRPTIYRRWPSKPALVVAALVESNQLALPSPDTGSLRGDLLEVQRRVVALTNAPNARRVTAGLIADLATDPELAEKYVHDYLVPRRATVWQVLQRAVDRGELDADVDFAFVYDLLVGPIFMRAVVWGQPLPPDAVEKSVDIVLAAYGRR
jgi:AcrR family transcriptional regulator